MIKICFQNLTCCAFIVFCSRIFNFRQQFKEFEIQKFRLLEYISKIDIYNSSFCDYMEKDREKRFQTGISNKMDILHNPKIILF